MDASDFVQASLILIGWFIVFRQALSLKHRDEVKFFVDQSRGVIQQINHLTEIYYSSSVNGHQNFTSSEIRAKFVLLSHYLIMINKYFECRMFSQLITNYKRNVTGGHFETVNFLQQKSIPGWLLEVSSSSNELIFRIDKEFFDWCRRRRFLGISY